MTSHPAIGNMIAALAILLASDRELAVRQAYDDDYGAESIQPYIRAPKHHNTRLKTINRREVNRRRKQKHK